MLFLVYSLGGSLIIAVCACLWPRDRYRDCSVALGLSLFSLFIPLLLRVTELVHIMTLDAQFYSIDRAIGLDPVRTWHLISRTPAIVRFLVVTYYALPLALAVVYSLERSMTMIRSAVIGGLGAFPFYFVFPAVGPAHVGSIAPRNCMPSLHFSWALLIALNARGNLVRIFASVFAAATAVATIGLGEHYFIDLIAAVPFSYAVQKAATWNEVAR